VKSASQVPVGTVAEPYRVRLCETAEIPTTGRLKITSSLEKASYRRSRIKIPITQVLQSLVTIFIVLTLLGSVPNCSQRDRNRTAQDDVI
jgi:hypothetical protein